MIELMRHPGQETDFEDLSFFKKTDKYLDKLPFFIALIQRESLRVAKVQYKKEWMQNRLGDLWKICNFFAEEAVHFPKAYQNEMNQLYDRISAYGTFF